VPRPLRWLLGAAILAAAGILAARPYVDAAAFIARAADLAGPPAALASWRSTPAEPPSTIAIATRGGDVPARVYRPAISFTRTIVLVPGVHRDGIDEARLVGLAQDLVATGFAVVTVAAPDLQRFRITAAVTDVIEDAIAWTADQPALAPDGRVGVLGVSFSGGLSIVAGGRERIRDRLAFIISFGGHGDLSRVMHYLASGEVLGDVDSARQSRVVAGADQVEVHPPHDYGVAVVLLTLAGQLVPADQVGPLTAGIEGFLLASSLDMVDKPRALEEFARMRAYAETLPEPAATLMRFVNDRAVKDLGARLLPVVDATASHPDMPALSPEKAPAPPAAPIFLLHGSDDNVIPSVETVLLGEFLQDRAPVRGLLSGLITHAEVDRAPTVTEAWRLMAFWRQAFAN
jgi:hypothetical protein